MTRVFIVNSNFGKKKVLASIAETHVRMETKYEINNAGEEIARSVEVPEVVLVERLVDNPDYVPKWICVNADNDLEVQNFLAMDGRELSAEDVERIFGNKACQASPLTTVVSDDGMEIVSFTPLPEREKSDDELAAEIRAARDVLLSETDHLVMPDYPISEEDLSLVKAYRQALRDITEQEGFPRSVEWPEKPEVIA